MKKILLLVIVVVGSIALWNYAKPDAKKISNVITKNEPEKQVIPQKQSTRYIFVPYWSFTTSIEEKADSYIYFGVGVNSLGVDRQDQGYKGIKKFIQLSPKNKEKILAVRMTDKNLNAAVLKDLSLQRKIASEASELAVQNGFSAILLDYETSAFGFDSTTNNITSFYQLFSQTAKKSGKSFYVTLYGDTYFRARPYDIKKISEVSDKVLVMAYDFSKSRGNPGPNFPFANKETYGYDFGKMIEDFQKDVDNQKLVIVVGYFGYDWHTDKEGNALASGVPLSTNEIKKEFVTSCKFDDCILNRSPEGDEPFVKYIDKDGTSHVVWFEDENSVAKKKEMLRSKGILEMGDWAYSYF